MSGGTRIETLVVGSGIAGLSCAIRAAELGQHVTLASPYVSERAQSVMAAGGINAALDTLGEGDTPALHAAETLAAGRDLEDPRSVRALCDAAPDVVRWLERLGVVFSRDAAGEIALRAFGGQSRRRTAYAGASTGKQIVTALVQRCRELEVTGRVERRLGLTFHSALIEGGRCHGAVFANPMTGEVVPVRADATIMATGGMNRLFGKTTGSELCDGYAAGRLLAQGVELRNLEFIQYHPTTIETSHKRMLVTEAARGEGGRLYYLCGGERVYFMEELFGERGNLMPRDVVSKCIHDCSSQVYLDITFLGERLIHERLGEVYDLCQRYLDLDVTRQSIPVAPSIHFFMGGIRVDDRHQTNVGGLYAVGECASKYHGANRLGGNSLLAAAYSGRVAAQAADDDGARCKAPSFDAYVGQVAGELARAGASRSPYPAEYVQQHLADCMNRGLGITRDADRLRETLDELAFYQDMVAHLRLDPQVSLYEGYRLPSMVLLGRAIAMSALAREESRGSHVRTDHPETREEYRACSVVRMGEGGPEVRFVDEARKAGEPA